MKCSIYRSSKRDQTYLYIENKDDFNAVPEVLLQSFGSAIFVMDLILQETKKLANADIEKVKAGLREQGFYLQIPPPVESLLKVVTD